MPTRGVCAVTLSLLSADLDVSAASNPETDFYHSTMLRMVFNLMPLCEPWWSRHEEGNGVRRVLQPARQLHPVVQPARRARVGPHSTVPSI